MSNTDPVDVPAVSPKQEIQPTKESSGCLGKTFAIGGIIASVIFLLNLTAGFIEIPDNLPFIGNLDEIIVTTFLLSCLSHLGINIIPRKK